MFTGLIEDVGKIAALHIEKHAAVLTVETKLPISEMSRGASIAVNGACLTVVKKTPKTFTVDVSPETLKRTSLRELAVGSAVNLERPMRLADRLGGHLVTGHVDGLAKILAMSTEGEFTIIRFAVPALMTPLLVRKGSVAIDGISLTVNDCRRGRFSVAIIPYTLQHTNLRARRVGDKVNVETDLIGKYVQSLSHRRE
ncbi:MAG TPA: riboflavin synthase [Candidatus Binatia bacterium]|jgi:riboflavin synthase